MEVSSFTITTVQRSIREVTARIHNLVSRRDWVSEVSDPLNLAEIPAGRRYQSLTREEIVGIVDQQLRIHLDRITSAIPRASLTPELGAEITQYLNTLWGPTRTDPAPAPPTDQEAGEVSAERPTRYERDPVI